MIKTKVISLILAGTVTGGGIIAGIISQINSNTQKATTQITQSTNDLMLASSAIDTAQKTIVSQNDKIQVISNKQKEANTNLALAQKDVSTQKDTIANLQKELAAEQAKVADLQKKLKYSQETTQVYINETEVLRQQVWAANTAVGMLQNDLDTADANLATANKNLAAKTKEVASLQKEVTSLKSELSAEQAKNAAQTSDINKLKAAVSTQTKSIDSVSASNSQAQANFQKSLASLNKTVQN